MFDVTIYYKDGRRSFFHDVEGVDHNGPTVGISLLNGRSYKDIPTEEIGIVTMTVVK